MPRYFFDFTDIVAKYMERQCRPPGQSWWTFLRNHLPDSGKIRRNVALTAHPTARHLLHYRARYAAPCGMKCDAISEYRIASVLEDSEV